MSEPIPGMLRKSPLGILREFQRDPLSLMMRLHAEYGGIAQMPGPLNMRIVSVADPDSVHEVLVTHVGKHQKPAALKKVFQSSFGNGLFFSEGDFWKRQRKLMQPAFHHGRIRQYSERIVRHTAEKLDSWQGQSMISLRKQMNALTLTIVVDAIFHADIKAETEAVYHAMLALGSAIGEQSVNPLLAALPDWFPHPTVRRKVRASKTLHTTIDRFIQQRRASGEDQGDLISSLLLARDAETGESMLDQQVRDEIMTLFIAGHETSSSVITAIFVMLAQHPEIESALHAELDETLGGRFPTHDDLPQLTLTRNIVKEALRLYPPAWLLLREATEPFAVGEYAIVRKDGVWISPYVIHRNPAHYPDPEGFNPHRWTAAFEESLPRYAYIPFGAGPRICIGNGFALQELHLMLATIASRVRITLPPDSRPEFHGGPTLTLKGDVPVILEPRSLPIAHPVAGTIP